MSMMLLDQETRDALQQLYGETIEAMELAKKSPDLDDLAAVIAVALLKLGLATGFVEQKYPGFAKDVEEIEDMVFDDEKPASASRLYFVKRELIEFRRAIFPLVKPIELLAAGKAASKDQVNAAGW